VNSVAWLLIAVIGVFIVSVLAWFLIDLRNDIKVARRAARVAKAAARGVTVPQLLAHATEAGHPVGLNWGTMATQANVEWPDRIEEYPTAALSRICNSRGPATWDQQHDSTGKPNVIRSTVGSDGHSDEIHSAINAPRSTITTGDS
jgi:hypothetical protein